MTNRECVLLVAPPASYRITAYIDAASALGMEILVASEGAHSLVSAVAKGVHIDLKDPQASLSTILDAVQSQKIVGIIGSDDSTVEIAALVGEALGLPHNSPRSAQLSRRKDHARRCLAEAGLPVPEYQCLSIEKSIRPEDVRVPFPLVIKPLALSASRGVVRVNSYEALLQMIERLQPIFQEQKTDYERAHVLLERFLPGREIAVEAMLQNGALTVLTIFDKPDPLDGPFFEETYYITPTSLESEVQQRVTECVASACESYGLRQGPVHAELRVQDGQPWILEIAARTIGGQCARLIQIAAGRSLEELVLENAIGQSNAMNVRLQAGGVLMIPTPQAGVLRRVEGVVAASKIRWIEDVEVSVREGYELVPLPEGASYLGFIFAKAPDAQQAEAALREAYAKLTVVVAPKWDIT